ncbi:NAD(P)/FAD-dependent oxidoreductase [Dactylosporangium sp. NPDC048998]|uniref:NAD(P)/FAD-dependent oxidoreductase n=1 Tax=Dactylosporangium sp. NPDC048998 TaxID=3363976 RepID=UPI00371594C9
MSVVVVGASLSGLRTVQALRRRGYDEPITLIGDERERPYDRPPLSKEFMAAPDASAPYLTADGELEGLGIELLLGRRATGLDPARRRVALAGGDTVPYETLVVATGATARRLAVPGADLGGVHCLRTLDDARALRRALDRTPRVVVVGGGFIGAEFASAARERGLDVTMIEREPAPFALSLGGQVGTALSRIVQDCGVAVRTGVSVVAAHGNGHVESIALSDGSRVDADLVLLGVGVAPATAWLEGSGVAVSDGVRCDAQLRSVSTPNVYAAGDVAAWPHPGLGREVRIEHWTNANEHADVVAGGITGDAVTAAAVPYVWSDQFGRRLQVVGRSAAGDNVQLVEANGVLSAAAWSRDGVLTAVLAIDAPRIAVRARKAIQQRAAAADFVREQLASA